MLALGASESGPRVIQKFVDISKATEADFQKATERVYRGGAQASSLVLPVLK